MFYCVVYCVNGFIDSDVWCCILYLIRFRYGLKLGVGVFLGKIDVKLVFYMING